MVAGYGTFQLRSSLFGCCLLTSRHHTAQTDNYYKTACAGSTFAIQGTMLSRALQARLELQL
jgi:hypothetical protein